MNAGRYVLALGGVENARVLRASRSQQREGVDNGHDVVGRYFMEHPHYYGSIGVVHASALDLSFYRRGDSDYLRQLGRATTRESIVAAARGALAAIDRSRDQPGAIRALVRAVREDFERGRTVQVEGWILSRTEAERPHAARRVESRPASSPSRPCARPATVRQRGGHGDMDRSVDTP